MVHTFPSNRIDVTLIVIHGVDENIAYFILRLTLKNQIQITLEKKNDAMHCTKLYSKDITTQKFLRLLK